MNELNDNERRALLRLAFHEAGHALAAEAYTGVPHVIAIERQGDQWHGQVEAVRGSLDRGQQAVHGVAGAVAEQFHVAGIWGVQGARLLEAIVERMSPNDRRIAGHFSRDDIDRAISLVHSNWHWIEERAQKEAERFEAGVERAEVKATAKALLDQVEADGRDDLRPDEQARFDQLLARAKHLKAVALAA